MSKVLVEESNLYGIADAIRSKLNSNTTYKVSQMAAAIRSIEDSSGGMPVPTATKQINENGTYDVTNYASAVVNVSAQSLPSANGVSF